MSRRRVDLSLRLEVANAVEFALNDWLQTLEAAGVAADDDTERRVRKALGAIRRGIQYVTIDNPTPQAQGRPH